MMNDELPETKFFLRRVLEEIKVAFLRCYRLSCGSLRRVLRVNGNILLYFLRSEKSVVRCSCADSTPPIDEKLFEIKVTPIFFRKNNTPNLIAFFFPAV